MQAHLSRGASLKPTDQIMQGPLKGCAFQSLFTQGTFSSGPMASEGLTLSALSQIDEALAEASANSHTPIDSVPLLTRGLQVTDNHFLPNVLQTFTSNIDSEDADADDVTAAIAKSLFNIYITLSCDQEPIRAAIRATIAEYSFKDNYAIWCNVAIGSLAVFNQWHRIVGVMIGRTILT